MKISKKGLEQCLPIRSTINNLIIQILKKATINSKIQLIKQIIKSKIQLLSKKNKI